MLKLVVCSLDSNQIDAPIKLIDQSFLENDTDLSSVFLSGADNLWQYLKDNQGNVDIILFYVWHHHMISMAFTAEITSCYPDIEILTIEHVNTNNDIPAVESTYILSKFVTMPELSTQLSNAIRDSEKLKIEVASNGHIYNLRLDHIHYIVSDKRLLVFHSAGRKIPIYCKLNEIEAKLGSDFVRCHQSYMVNMNRIMSFDKSSIELYSGVKIPVSRTRYPHAYASFLRHTASCSY